MRDTSKPYRYIWVPGTVQRLRLAQRLRLTAKKIGARKDGDVGSVSEMRRWGT